MSENNVKDFEIDENGVLTGYTGSDTEVVVPEGAVELDDFFIEGDVVTAVTLPSTVSKISLAAFFEISNLKNIFVDEANPVYKSIDGCLYSKDGKRFLYCPDRTEPLTIAEGCEVIESYAFFKREVGEIIFPSTLKRFEHSALCNCTMTADELVIPHDFELCGGEWFNATTLPPRVTVKGMAKLPSAIFAFSKFTSMRLPDTLIEIGDCAFGKCLMERVYVPKSVVKLGERIFESDRPFEGVEGSDAFYDFTYDYGFDDLYDEESEEFVPTVMFTSCPDGFVLGVDNEECAAAQYARENNIPYEVVTDVEEFLSMNANKRSESDEWMEKAYACEEDEEAAECFAKAAELGDTLAKFYLGQHYEHGKGVPQDYKKAAELYMAVSRCRDYLVSYDHHPQGCAEYAVGSFYERGLLPDSTMEKAVAWYNRAHWSGNLDAYFKLMECYLNGQGVRKNCNSAAKMLCEYCWRYGANDDRVFSIAKQLENEKTKYQADIFRVLCLCYANGVGTEKNSEKTSEYSGMYAAWKEAEEFEGLNDKAEYVTPVFDASDDGMPF